MAFYDKTFFDYTAQQSKLGAENIVPIVNKLIGNINSVVDFGCAQGVWLDVWKKNGVHDILGVDGDYVDINSLFISDSDFFSADLNQSISLSRKFDLVYSLEVAEHLKPESSKKFIDTLVAHSDFVLFSAAVPGQGGENHINEQSMETWRELFRKKGFFPYDCVRPLLKDKKEIAFWYRYNIILYVNDTHRKKLSEQIKATEIRNSEKIKDISPEWFKLRKICVRLLPRSFQNCLARVKSKVKVR